MLGTKEQRLKLADITYWERERQ